MNLLQLSVLLDIVCENVEDPDFNDSNVKFLLDEGWLTKATREGNDEPKLRPTQQAINRLNSILPLFVGNKIDPKIIENYENQISYEIRHNSASFVKTKQITIKIMAKPEIMNELCNRYSQVGWTASFKDGSITLRWNGKKS